MCGGGEFLPKFKWSWQLVAGRRQVTSRLQMKYGHLPINMQTYTPTQQTAITEWRGRTDSTFTDIIECDSGLQGFKSVLTDSQNWAIRSTLNVIKCNAQLIFCLLRLRRKRQIPSRRWSCEERTGAKQTQSRLKRNLMMKNTTSCLICWVSCN